MIVGQILSHKDSAVPHITDADRSRSGLFRNKFRDAAELQAEAVSSIVVNQNKELQSSPIALQGDPCCDRILLVALKDLHVTFGDSRHLCTVACLDGHDHV